MVRLGKRCGILFAALAVLTLTIMAIVYTFQDSEGWLKLRAMHGNIRVGMSRRQVFDMLGPPGDHGGMGAYGIEPDGVDLTKSKKWFFGAGALVVEFDDTGKVGGSVLCRPRRSATDQLLEMFVTHRPKSLPRDRQLVWMTTSDFIHQIITSHFQYAFSLTSATFQQRYSLDQFRALFQGQSIFRDGEDRNTEMKGGNFQVPANATRVSLTVSVKREHSSGSLTLVLVKTDSTWEIDEVTIPGPTSTLDNPPRP